jgi:hypothetical protein
MVGWLHPHYFGTEVRLKVVAIGGGCGGGHCSTWQKKAERRGPALAPKDMPQ